MPFDYNIETQSRFLVIRGSNESSMDEAEESALKAYEAFRLGKIPPDFGVLVIVNTMSIVIEERAIKKIELYIGLLQGCMSGPIAIVASTVGTALPAQIISLRTGHMNHEVGAFFDEPSARAWLLRHAAKPAAAS